MQMDLETRIAMMDLVKFIYQQDNPSLYMNTMQHWGDAISNEVMDMLHRDIPPVTDLRSKWSTLTDFLNEDGHGEESSDDID